MTLTKLALQGPPLALGPSKALFLILYLKCSILFLKEVPQVVYKISWTCPVDSACVLGNALLSCLEKQSVHRLPTMP